MLSQVCSFQMHPSRGPSQLRVKSAISGQDANGSVSLPLTMVLLEPVGPGETSLANGCCTIEYDVLCYRCDSEFMMGSSIVGDHCIGS